MLLQTPILERLARYLVSVGTYKSPKVKGDPKFCFLDKRNGSFFSFV